jgi:hypothetical protein
MRTILVRIFFGNDVIDYFIFIVKFVHCHFYPAISFTALIKAQF